MSLPRSFGIALVTSLAAGCATAPVSPPLPAPRVVRTASFQPGTALARDAGGAADTTRAPWLVEVHVVALEQAVERGQPLIEHARLLTDTGSAHLLQIAPTLLASARLESLAGRDPAAVAAALASGRATDCGVLRGALYPGTTAVFQLATERYLGGRAAREFLRLRVERSGGDALRLALVARAWQERAGELAPREELLLLEDLEERGAVLFGPAPGDPGYACYALILGVRDGDGGPGEAILAERAQRELARLSLPRRPRHAASGGGDLAPLTSAALATGERADWLRVAQAGGATLSAHALGGLAEEEEAALRAAWAEAVRGHPAGGVDWALEHTTALRLAGSSDPAARALLVERCGAVGATDSLLRDTLALAQDLAGWERQLREENRYQLRAPQAASRSRAHDWLRARGLSVPGYDPLAPAAERRAALGRGEGP